MFRFFIALLLLAANTFAVAEPLTLDSALEIAARTAPDVEMQNANVEQATAASTAAGRLPDPRLTLGIENVPAEGADQWSLTHDFMTMRKVGIMQEVPNRSKRRAARDAAAAAVSTAQLERRTRLLVLRRDTAVAWFTRFYAEQRAALFDELDRENRLFADAVQAQLLSGKSTAAEAIVPQQEAAELADRRDDLARELAQSRNGLARWIGVAADAPLANITPALPIDAQRLRAHVHEHPELAVFAPMTAMAQAEVHAAEATKQPDWGVEVAYAKRGDAFDDMVSLELTVGLPLFARTRQDPQIAAKRQALRRIEAERYAMLRDHTQELDNDLADYEALSRQLERMRSTRVPLAQRQVDYEFASYRAGKGALTSVLGARRELIDRKLELIQLEGQRAVAAAKLYFIYGEGAQ
ncbi:MAG TPA: TolC family protein [Steroidobacteraceae bacterium]|nr:TolC family protein [Steroidobacteraceae bacterium]